LEEIDVSEALTLVPVLETEVLEALTKRAAKLNRSYTIVCGLVIERPVFQKYAVGICVAALVDVIAVLWLNIRVDDVLESRCCIRIICGRCLSWFRILMEEKRSAFGLWFEIEENIQSPVL
jgi:hypothetical protein